jgi:hypothetical protein
LEVLQLVKGAEAVEAEADNKVASFTLVVGCKIGFFELVLIVTIFFQPKLRCQLM